MENTPNPKCTRCKCYWKPDETDIKTSGLVCKTCKKCRGNDMKNKNKCEHGRRKSQCRECGGVSICEHGRQKSQCRECGGSQICQHGKQRSKCRDCGGSQFCQHDKIKSTCRECGGASFCEHGRQKSTCRECNGSSFCQHDKIKSTCRDCGGSSICQHDKIKSICRECGGGSFCEHGRPKSKCRECGGGSICQHGRQKPQCRECGGSQICQHGKQRSKCRECGGSSICEHGRRKSTCRECNLALCLINLQRVHIRNCFNISNLEKTNPSISYLGCDMKYFMEYFQKKIDLFNKYSEIEMTWDNIHIDHIKPVSSFNLDDKDEFLNCCHYSNMQPLLAEINLNKSCKWSEKNEEFWLNNIKGKEYLDLYLP